MIKTSERYPDLYYKKLLLVESDLLTLNATQDSDEKGDEALMKVLELPLNEFVGMYLEYRLRKHNLDLSQIDEDIKNVIFFDNLWYKIFFLSDTNKRKFMNLVEKYFVLQSQENQPNPPSVKKLDIRAKTGLQKMLKETPIFSMKGADFLFNNVYINCGRKDYVTFLRLYIYIMQFMDKEKAEMYGFNFLPFYDPQKGYLGFNLEEKLETLGELYTIIIQMFIGVGGRAPASIHKIAEYTGLQVELIRSIIGDIAKRICIMTSDALKNHINNQGESKLNEYEKKGRRELNGYELKYIGYFIALFQGKPEKLEESSEKHVYMIEEIYEKPPGSDSIQDEKNLITLQGQISKNMQASDDFAPYSDYVSDLDRQYRFNELSGPEYFNELVRCATEVVKKALIREGFEFQDTVGKQF